MEVNETFDYRVNDCVHIRDDIAKFGFSKYPGVNEDMERYAGCITTIKKEEFSDGRKTYRIDIDGGKWMWASWMFCESQEVEDLDTKAFDDFLREFMCL